MSPEAIGCRRKKDRHLGLKPRVRANLEDRFSREEAGHEGSEKARR